MASSYIFIFISIYINNGGWWFNKGFLYYIINLYIRVAILLIYDRQQKLLWWLLEGAFYWRQLGIVMIFVIADKGFSIQSKIFYLHDFTLFMIWPGCISKLLWKYSNFSDFSLTEKNSFFNFSSLCSTSRISIWSWLPWFREGIINYFYAWKRG